MKLGVVSISLVMAMLSFSLRLSIAALSRTPARLAANSKHCRPVFQCLAAGGCYGREQFLHSDYIRPYGVSANYHHGPRYGYRLPVTTKGFCSDTEHYNVYPEELVDMIETGDLQLFDVREPQELEESGRIPGAVNIPCTYVDWV